MLKYPQIDPVIFTLGPLQPRWYGLMYLIGFLYTFRLLRKHARWIGFHPDKADSVLATLVVGLIATARIVYVLFYNLKGTLKAMAEPFSNPNATAWDMFLGLIEPLAIWNGGLAFHGGLLGVVLAGVYVAKKYKLKWQRLTDVLALGTPVGLGLGRVANFINGELWGRVTDVPWAMVFPGAGDLPRHPSQLYQAFLEGPVLFAILAFTWRRKPRVGMVSATFLFAYAFFRISMELVREPDAQVGFLFGGATMGQLLSLTMLVYGAWMVVQAKRDNIPQDSEPATAKSLEAQADPDDKPAKKKKKK